MVRLGVFGRVVNDLHHGEDGAHAVGHAAAAAGLLAHAAVAQGDFLILLPHGVFPHPHLGEDEGSAGISGLRVVGDCQLDAALELLVENPVHNHGDFVLPLLVDVKQAHFRYVQVFPPQGDGFNDTGGKGAASANQCDNHSVTSFLLLLVLCLDR